VQVLARVAGIVAVIFAAGCHPGGEYAGSSMQTGQLDRGETNGRMFDFVSDKPEGDDWQIRIRGNSIWASYSHEDKTDQLGTRTLTEKEATKIWEMIDGLDIPSRKKGKKDDDNGTVTLRLREPGDEKHDIYTIYISRETDDSEVTDLAEYLRKVVATHFSEKPNF
jgi:hypothetical protein